MKPSTFRIRLGFWGERDVQRFLTLNSMINASRTNTFTNAGMIPWRW